MDTKGLCWYNGCSSGADLQQLTALGRAAQFVENGDYSATAQEKTTHNCQWYSPYIINPYCLQSLRSHRVKVGW